MLTASRSWIKGWLRAITVEQSLETVLPVTDRQTVPLSYYLRDLHLTRVISVFMNSRLYYCNSLFLHIQLPSLKWKSIQNITSSQRQSLQPTIPHLLYPILSSAATLNTAKNWKVLFSLPVLSRGVDNLPNGWLHSVSFGSPTTAPMDNCKESVCVRATTGSFRSEQEQATLVLKGNSRQFLQL